MAELKLRFVVNGTDVVVGGEDDQPLLLFAEKALDKSGNLNRPLTEWEMREERGALVDQRLTPARYNFKMNEPLFLTVRTGFGG